MIARYRAILILFGLAVLSGCASTRVTQQTSAGEPAVCPSESNLGLRLHHRPGQDPNRFPFTGRPQCAEHTTHLGGTGRGAQT